MVIIDVKPKDLGIPTEAYHAIEEICEGAQQQWSFKHVPSQIGALESEEVGVEHLLRDVRDTTISTLASQVCSWANVLFCVIAVLSSTLPVPTCRCNRCALLGSEGGPKVGRP